jgi:glycosidase
MGLAGHVCSLIGLRHKHRALRYGGYRQVSLEYRRPYVFERLADGEWIIVAVNIGDSEETVSIGNSAVDLLSGERFEGQAPLQPVSARVLLRLS